MTLQFCIAGSGLVGHIVSRDYSHYLKIILDLAQTRREGHVKHIRLGYALFAAAVLVGCQTNRGAETDALSAASTDCLRREAKVIAPKAVDLETAALGVLARCHAETTAEDNSFSAEYPGSRIEIRPYLAKMDAARLEGVRRMVAVLRVQ
jgi:hypothetical protein